MPSVEERLAKKFESSDLLNRLAAEIVDLDQPELHDAKQFSYRIAFTSKEFPDHWAGKCRKIDDAIRFHAKFDFLILINKTEWDKVSTEGKLHILCHELHHIGESDEGKPKIRRHGGDFCEIAEHDAFSLRLAKKVRPHLHLAKQLETQTELRLEAPHAPEIPVNAK